VSEKYRIDDLQTGGRMLKQNKELFCFGIDAVLLANYAANFVQKEHKVMDLGCGNGIIPVLLSAKCAAGQIDGVELNKESAMLAKENIALNRLINNIHFLFGFIGHQTDFILHLPDMTDFNACLIRTKYNNIRMRFLGSFSAMCTNTARRLLARTNTASCKCPCDLFNGLFVPAIK
jgi:SAM-dependent methyltransferase